MNLRASRAISLRTVSPTGRRAVAASRRPLSGAAHRKAQLARATPAWSNPHEIFAIYCLARELRDGGKDVVVDHIIPLAAADVCGLHVPGNLRIVDRRSNELKSNNNYELPEVARPRSAQLALF